ncbi:RNA polymerase sigma factor [Sungkyunkwania multivorans]|uniref:RNA polymerase sigma factor n=1 Tax=Sungkyunkwania multivorans TaxID=1173618 RepID=A0ABW3CTK9_9FLAO
MTNQSHQDQRYIEGLKTNDSFVIKEIYKNFVPKVINYIKNNNGDEMQAKDVVQEVLITIYDQAKHKDLQLTCPFDAYFFLLCKRRWLNELKKTSKKEVTINEEVTSKYDDATELAAQTSIEAEKRKLFALMFQKLGDKCKELLSTSFKVRSMEEVAKQLGVSYAYARKKKSLCTGKLTELVVSSKEYQRLKQTS